MGVMIPNKVALFYGPRCSIFKSTQKADYN